MAYAAHPACCGSYGRSSRSNFLSRPMIWLYRAFLSLARDGCTPSPARYGPYFHFATNARQVALAGEPEQFLSALLEVVDVHPHPPLLQPSLALSSSGSMRPTVI